jgi:hypothetical protein
MLAFVIVSVGILVLRVREPNLPCKFTTPWVWFVALAGAISGLALRAALPWPTWQRLLVWFAVGIVIYFFYGVRWSNLAQPPTTDTKPATSGRSAGLCTDFHLQVSRALGRMVHPHRVILVKRFFRRSSRSISR